MRPRRWMPRAPHSGPGAGNLSYRFRKGDAAAVAAAMAGAATVVALDLVNNRVTAAPAETRTAIASYDAVRDAFLLQVSGQGVHAIRDQLAADVLHMPKGRIAVVAPDVGGGFGAKNFLFPEYVLLLFAARRLRRPVRWAAERMEDFLSNVHGRDNRTKARLALDAQGRFLPRRETVANLGAYLSGGGPGARPTRRSAMAGALRDSRHRDGCAGAFTNTTRSCLSRRRQAGGELHPSSG